MHRAPDSLPLVEAMQALGIRLAEEFLVATRGEAAELAAQLGYPLWVRSHGEGDPRYCARLDTPDDLPLALAQAASKSPSASLILQRPIDGPTFRAFARGEDIHVFEAKMIEGPPYRLLEGLVTLPPTAHPVLWACMQALAKAAPVDAWLEAELLFDDFGPVLSAVWLHGHLPAILAHLPVGAEPDAVAAWWLDSRSGRIVSIAGVDEARSLPGVLHVAVAAEPGRAYRHVIDEAGSNQLGFVLARGHDTDSALRIARAAAALIRINTTAMLD